MANQYTIGIIGGGQLARMMHQASIGLSVQIRLLSESSGSSAAQVIADVTVGDYTDPETLSAFAAGCHVITFDHEHVPTALLHRLQDAGVLVRPGPEALVYAQDKALMRERLSGLGVPVPAFRVCASEAELIAFGEAKGWPVIAKTSRGGYDGKGVFKLDSPAQAGEPFAAKPEISAGEAVRIVAEEYIDFTRELSALVVREPGGQSVAYPVSQTLQRAGVCAETLTPAPDLSDEAAADIQQMALRIAAELGVVGVLAVELMQTADGRVFVNELAMRPHNTGHWSIDGALTSQFENHLRAVLGLPLGSPAMRASHVAMANVLGGSVPDLVAGLGHCLAEDPRLRVHLYGKPVTPGRKVGHVTTLDSTASGATQRARHAANYLMGDQHA
ncbi:MAG: 5-(carboxyamino)imidazole ribonucleotide synthase [Propionibacteriaceae bacterium]|nr:5-(carboxyamino)imidazole ribonucleotide synthase [Propionibacteriaceae bacterium]